MLIGEILEKAPIEESWQLSANKVADTIRNIWLENKAKGISAWEESFEESGEQVERMRKEGFKDVYEIDYIFKWWDNFEDPDGLAGEFNVIWKTENGDENHFYKTVCRLANRDFILGTYSTETRKREAFRAEFQQAFNTWRKLFQAL